MTRNVENLKTVVADGNRTFVDKPVELERCHFAADMKHGGLTRALFAEKSVGLMSFSFQSVVRGNIVRAECVVEVEMGEQHPGEFQTAFGDETVEPAAFVVVDHARIDDNCIKSSGVPGHISVDPEHIEFKLAYLHFLRLLLRSTYTNAFV